MVAPLLALLLANKGTLCVEVVPRALLEFSRETMRSRFTAIIQKPIYTFNYDRFSPVTPDMYNRLAQARDRQAIVMTHPSALKSLALKFLEFVHHLDKNSQIKVESSAGLLQRALGMDHDKQKQEREIGYRKAELLAKATECAKMLALFRAGSLILDEVDLLLHPLKSELNWPLGVKAPLDFTNSAAGYGLRWDIPFHILDALFYATGHTLTVDFGESREALLCLARLRAAVEAGVCSLCISTCSPSLRTEM